MCACLKFIFLKERTKTEFAAASAMIHECVFIAEVQGGSSTCKSMFRQGLVLVDEVVGR